MDIDLILAVLNTGTTGIAMLAGVYLLTKFLNRPQSPMQAKEIELMRQEVKELRNAMVHSPYAEVDEIHELAEQVEKIKESQLGISSKEQKELIEQVKAQILESAEKRTLESIKETLNKEKLEKDRIDVIAPYFESTIERLKEELFALSKRGNLNLSIGIVTTISGLIVLGMLVLSGSPIPKDQEQFLIEFIPRISLVILIEVFAYFFLKLYKASLSEIKYFQNEITTIEAKYLSLRVALHDGDSSNINSAIESLSKTERNFILDKGQSTVELERSKIDNQNTQDLVGKLSSLIEKNPNK